jgi:hypothetical protein
MSAQHLSDEAIAAFADDVLTGHARQRATRHAMSCPECAYAVAVQREAVWALRAAPAPALPTGLLDRLRAVPETTPISGGPGSGLPAAIAPDGTPMFASFGSSPFGAAALVPTRSGHHKPSRVRPIAFTAAAVAVAGVVAASAGAAGDHHTNQAPTSGFVQTGASVHQAGLTGR